MLYFSAVLARPRQWAADRLARRGHALSAQLAMHRGSSSDPQRRYEQALAARDAADSKMAEARAAEEAADREVQGAREALQADSRELEDVRQHLARCEDAVALRRERLAAAQAATERARRLEAEEEDALNLAVAALEQVQALTETTEANQAFSIAAAADAELKTVEAIDRSFEAEDALNQAEAQAAEARAEAEALAGLFATILADKSRVEREVKGAKGQRHRTAVPQRNSQRAVTGQPQPLRTAPEKPAGGAGRPGEYEKPWRVCDVVNEC